MQRLAPSIAALLFGIVAAGALATLVAVELRRTVPETGTSSLVRKAADARAEARSARLAERDASFDAPFDPGMVRHKVVWKGNAGERPTVDVALVNATGGADLSETARRCAEWAARPGHNVQCYVFANTESYEFKNISATLPATASTAIVNLCWAVLARAPLGDELTLSDMRQAPQTWESQGCPNSWTGTAR